MNFLGRVFSSLTGSSTPISGFEYDFKLDDPDATTVTMSCGVTWTLRNGTRLSTSSSSGNSGSSSSSSSGGGGGDGSGGALSESEAEKMKQCTILSSKIPAGGGQQEELVRNVLKRVKGLVALPGMLRCFDCIENDGTIYIATDRCVPLRRVANDPISFYCGAVGGRSDVVHHGDGGDADDEDGGATNDEEKFQVAVSFGMHTVAGALCGMHRNNLFHGQVNLDSVFVLSESGEWRLFGLEFVAPIADITEQTTAFRNVASLLSHHVHRVPPEAGGIGGPNPPSRIPQPAVHLADSWGLGILLLETFLNGQKMKASAPPSMSSPNDIRTAAAKCGMPRAFVASYITLVNVNPKLRCSVEKFRDEAEMLHGPSSTKAARLMSELDELQIKDAADRDHYYRDLAGCVRDVPQKLAEGLILTKISNQLHYGGGISAAALGPLLQIARKMSADSFASRVGPSVVVMFSSQEPLVRMKLLESADVYAKLLPTKLMCERIWPLYLQGLTSKIPELRELSVRALVHFAPALGDRFASGDVVKAILALQQDTQGAIRTNATICLGMLAKYIPVETRAKTLCNGLGRMLKDPFAASRTAAVRTISSLLHTSSDSSSSNSSTPSHHDSSTRSSSATTSTVFTVQMGAEMLLPALCPMMLDADRGAREAATKAVKDLTEFVVRGAEDIPFAAAPPPSGGQQHSGNTNSTSTTISQDHSNTSSANRTPVAKNPQTSSFPSPSSSSSLSGTQTSSSVVASMKVAAKTTTPASSTSSSHHQPTTKHLPSSDLWDDVEFSIPSSKPAAKTFKPQQTTTTTTTTATSTSAGGDSTKKLSHWEDEDDTEFELAPPTKTSSVVSSTPQPQQQQQQQQQQPLAAATTAPSPPAAVSLSSSSSGMKLGGGDAPKKRGFGGVKKS